MASRARTVAIVLGVTAGVLVTFFFTVWVLMSILEGKGFPGGPRVAVVEIDGIIIESEPVVEELKSHAENQAVRAVVVRINSPGGVVAPTQEIYAAMRRVAREGKPVVASLGPVAASGGYYLAAAADRIYASPGTLTGSIGVMMQMATIEGLLKKVGVEYVVVKSGKYKDIGSFSRTMSPEERRLLQALIDDVYNQFVDAVAEGRKLTREAVMGFADGRIVSGRQAAALGMVDVLGGLEEAVEGAAELGGLPPKPRLILPRRRFSIFDWLKGQLGFEGGSFSRLLPLLRVPLYLME
jgi:protease-4